MTQFASRGAFRRITPTATVCSKLVRPCWETAGLPTGAARISLLNLCNPATMIPNSKGTGRKKSAVSSGDIWLRCCFGWSGESGKSIGAFEVWQWLPLERGACKAICTTSIGTLGQRLYRTRKGTRCRSPWNALGVRVPSSLLPAMKLRSVPTPGITIPTALPGDTSEY